MHEIYKTKIAALLTVNQCIKFISKTDSLGQKPNLGTKNMN
jgi:hypothetical protein